jgi:5-formyltetrahydrofolate cyclo-ligase
MADNSSQIQDMLNEYLMLLAPLARADEEISMTRKMLQVKTEEDIHKVAPALKLVSEVLNISTIDLLLANNKTEFLMDALNKSGMSMEDMRERLLKHSETTRDDLKLLGLPDAP